MMKALVLAALLCLLDSALTKISAPKVQVYSRVPLECGKNNTLICHASNFHPPEIQIQLLKNGVEMPHSNLSDLAFEENWHYHMTRFVRFTPIEGEKFTCMVTHLGKATSYVLDPDM